MHFAMGLDLDAKQMSEDRHLAASSPDIDVSNSNMMEFSCVSQDISASTRCHNDIRTVAEASGHGCTLESRQGYSSDSSRCRSDPERPPSPDFSHLEEDERQRIVEVLRKLQVEERNNLRYMRTDLRDRAVTSSAHMASRNQHEAHHVTCKQCTIDVLRSCSRWTRDEEKKTHQCDLRRRHLALSGSWYNGIDTMAETTSMCSYLISKATVAKKRVSITVQAPSIDNEHVEESEESHEQEDASSDINKNDDIIATGRLSTSPLPEDYLAGNSPRCSIDSGVDSLGMSTASQSILTDSYRRRMSAESRTKPRRVSFSQALQEVRMYDPGTPGAMMIQVVDALPDEDGEVTTSQQHSTQNSTLDSLLSMAEESGSPTGNRYRTEATSNSVSQSPSPVAPSANISITGPLQIWNDDQEERTKVGEILVALQRSRYTNGQVSFKIKVSRGSNFAFPPVGQSAGRSGAKDSPISRLIRDSSQNSNNGKNNGQLFIKCHMIQHDGQQGSKFFRVHSKRSMTSMAQSPIFGDQFVGTFKEANLAKFSAIKVTVIQRKYVGLLRRPVTAIYGSLRIAIGLSYDGMSLAGMYTLTSQKVHRRLVHEHPLEQRHQADHHSDEHDCGNLQEKRPSLDCVSAASQATTTVKESNLQRRLQGRIPDDEPLHSLRRCSSNEEIYSASPTSIKRFGSLENLLM